MTEYIEWARDKLSVDFGIQACTIRYRSNVAAIVSAIEESPFFRDIDPFLREVEANYQNETDVPLFMAPQPFAIERKSFSSAVDKSFRTNVLWNSRFPNPPKGGWMTPNNWYSQLNDIVRTTLVCRFLDGPQFVADKLVEYAEAKGLRSDYYSQERDEGYYAFHSYTRFTVDLPKDDWNYETHEVKLEVQLRTQLQDVLKELTHQFYEKRRISPDRDNGKWKWQYKTPRFRASYLSHTLHMLEAIIVELREGENGGHVSP